MKLLLLFAAFAVVSSLPRHQRQLKKPHNFLGEGTNELAVALIQGFADQDTNLVFSPFAYSTILAIISEGARGETRNEIRTALHLPEDQTSVRAAYKDVLSRLRKKNDNAPEFKNWFYVYKNYSVEEDFKNILQDYYLTEVKTVTRPEDYDFEIDSQNNKKTPVEPSKPEDQPQIPVDPDKLASEIIVSGVAPHKQDAEEANSNNQAALFDEKEKDKTEEKVTTEKVDETTTVLPEEVTTAEPIKLVEEKDMMVAMERSLVGDQKDKFAGMTDSSLKIKKNGQNETKSQMIIFNGLYFNGEWDFKFTKNAADDTKSFYKSETEKVVVPTIHSEGNFNVGKLPQLDSVALELPYKGGRYSLLVLLPDSRNGLQKLISDLSGISVSDLVQELTPKDIEFCLPNFEITTLSKPISSLSKLGISKVTKVFSADEADLTGISSEQGLFVEELVQFVTFKVDDEKAEASQITASSAASRTEVEKVTINHPFLFFLRDRIDDVIIVSGKVVDPSLKDDDSWKKNAASPSS